MEKQARGRGESKTPEKAFANVLRELRKRRKLSQEELGYESGYHRTYISMLERGMMNPSLRTILSLANALRTSAADVVGRVEKVLLRK